MSRPIGSSSRARHGFVAVNGRHAGPCRATDSDHRHTLQPVRELHDRLDLTPGAPAGARRCAGHCTAPAIRRCNMPRPTSAVTSGFSTVCQTIRDFWPEEIVGDWAGHGTCAIHTTPRAGRHRRQRRGRLPRARTTSSPSSIPASTSVIRPGQYGAGGKPLPGRDFVCTIRAPTAPPAHRVTLMVANDGDGGTSTRPIRRLITLIGHTDAPGCCGGAQRYHPANRPGTVRASRASPRR